MEPGPGVGGPGPGVIPPAGSPYGMYSGGVTNEIPHIASATTTATAGGGTINSSDLMRAPRGT